MSNDPDGQLPQVIVGALIGAALGAAVEIGVQYAAGAGKSPEGFNVRAILASAAGGAVGGALAGATFGASLIAQGAASGAINVVAVSYTHLTLPTICSV